MVLPINLKLYLLIKRNSFASVQITVFVFIFGLPTIVNHKERARGLGLKSTGLKRALGGYKNIRQVYRFPKDCT